MIKLIIGGFGLEKKFVIGQNRFILNRYIEF